MITFVLSQVFLDPIVLYLTEKTREDAIPAIVAHYRLNDPWPVRYGTFLWNLINGDWGVFTNINSAGTGSHGSAFSGNC